MKKRFIIQKMYSLQGILDILIAMTFYCKEAEQNRNGFVKLLTHQINLIWGISFSHGMIQSLLEEMTAN